MPDHNSVDEHVEWLKSRLDYRSEMAAAYREARSLEPVRVAEELRDLYSTAGVLVVDAQGHGVISAKIASTVHDTFHAFMLAELDRHEKTTPELLGAPQVRQNRTKRKNGSLSIGHRTSIEGRTSFRDWPV